MDDNAYAPGPTPNTVRAADGTILAAPVGWVLLPPGDAGLARRLKAAGDHRVVREKVGRRLFSRGIWAASATNDRIRAGLEAERSTEGYARKQEAASRRREVAQASYVRVSWSPPTIRPAPSRSSPRPASAVATPSTATTSSRSAIRSPNSPRSAPRSSSTAHRRPESPQDVPVLEGRALSRVGHLPEPR